MNAKRISDPNDALSTIDVKKSRNEMKIYHIEQLPIEMLLKIFDYLPTFCDVSLVNKLFYDVACKVHDPHICLMVRQWLPVRIFYCPSIFSSDNKF